MKSSRELVQLDRSDKNVAVLTLSDPEHLNALSDELSEEFARRLEELGREPARAVILTGGGRAFSAGGDLAMLKAKSRRSAADNQVHMLAFYHRFLDMLDLGVPLIAAINGWAVGAGFCLACACDIRVSDPAASFAAPFLKLGLFPGMGSTVLLQRVLGPRAIDLLLTGRKMGSQEAYHCGLVSQLSEPGKVLELAREVAGQIVEGGPEVGRQLLQLLRKDPLELAAALEREALLQGQSYAGEEFRLGIERALNRSQGG